MVPMRRDEGNDDDDDDDVGDDAVVEVVLALLVGILGTSQGLNCCHAEWISSRIASI